MFSLLRWAVLREDKNMKHLNIQEYTTKKGEKRYILNGAYIGVDNATGKQVRSTVRGKTKKEVKTKLSRLKVEFEKNGFTNKKKAKIQTFNELALEWFEMYRKTVKINSVKQTESMLNTYILPAFANYKLDKLTPSVIQRIINGWADNATKDHEGAYRATGNGKHYSLMASTVKRILKYGVSLEVVESNCALNIYVPKMKDDKQEKEVKHYTKEELILFLSGIDTLKDGYKKEIVKAYFHLLAFSGMRPSEALALDWVDLDFEEKTVNINKTLDRYGNPQDTPKTKKSRRVVYLDNDTIAVMRKWKMYQARENMKIGHKQSIGIFTKIISRKYFHRSEMMYTAKLVFAETGLHDIGLHGFRHTHASLMLNAGVDYKTIQERLGHENISITMNTYSHIAKEKETEAVELMENYLKFS